MCKNQRSYLRVYLLSHLIGQKKLNDGGVVKVLVAMGAELLAAEGRLSLRDTWVCGGRGRDQVVKSLTSLRGPEQQV